MANNFSVNSDSLQESINQFKLRTLAAVDIYMKTEAKDLEGYAKRNRPWTDRTGDARKRLTGKESRIPEGFEIALVHGVEYGIWLELAHEKNYAILEPTIRLKGTDVVDGLKGLLEKIGEISSGYNLEENSTNS